MANTSKKGADVHDPTSSPTTPDRCSCAATVARLRAEIDALRTQMAEEVTTHHLTITDLDGRPRIRLTAAAGPADDPAPEIALLDADGHARIRLISTGDDGHVVLRARTGDGEPTQVDLFALDADPEEADDHPYVGVELIDRGDSVAGFSHHRTCRPQPWWLAPDE